ncbi:MAG: iron chelate uptake ABC transporter family permease subunit, partial [Sphingopyxis sp.]
MNRFALPRWSLIAALALLTLVAAVASLLFGAVDLSVARLLAAATGDGDKVASIILFDLRLPRTILALAVGAMLGLAGAALQGYLRNPLAEPSVLGTSNAAALGGVAAIYFGLADIHPIVLPLLATGGALLSLALLFILSGKAESPLTLILAGIAVGTLAVAGTSL